MTAREIDRNLKGKVWPGPIEARLAALEAGHAALEVKALKAAGPWQRGTEYAGADCVQHDGSIWRCIETHTSGATFSHEHFLLQIKRDRDGRMRDDAPSGRSRRARARLRRCRRLAAIFLESHGATVTLRADHSVRVDLDSMPGLNADTAHRWAPIITNLIPEFRKILKARRV